MHSICYVNPRGGEACVLWTCGWDGKGEVSVPGGRRYHVLVEHSGDCWPLRILPTLPSIWLLAAVTPYGTHVTSHSVLHPTEAMFQLLVGQGIHSLCRSSLSHSSISERDCACDKDPAASFFWPLLYFGVTNDSHSIRLLLATTPICNSIEAGKHREWLATWNSTWLALYPWTISSTLF